MDESVDTKKKGRLFRLLVIFFIMAKIGCFTFGGGWSIIGQMQNEFVEKRKWMTEEQIVDFLSLAKSFPGVMIINMSVLCGYMMEGPMGALAAAFGLSAPAILAKVLNGVRCVVIPIILNASWKLKSKSLVSRISYVLFAVSFLICAFTNVSKPLVIVLGALLGLVIWRGVNEDAAA